MCSPFCLIQLMFLIPLVFLSIYPAPLDVAVGPRGGAGLSAFSCPDRGGTMQDAGYEPPRTLLQGEVRRTDV